MRESADRLFAVTLGGRAPRCNTELHDVVFVTGATIEATYEQLMSLWFGTPEGLHIDSWLPLDIVDGHRVRLVAAKPKMDKPKMDKPKMDRPKPDKALYFVNLGAYADGLFGELHANMFLVAADAAAAKARAKRSLMQGGEQQIHTDDLYDVDDCIAVRRVGRWHVALEPTDAAGATAPVNGYHLIPKAAVAALSAGRDPRS